MPLWDCATWRTSWRTRLKALAWRRPRWAWSWISWINKKRRSTRFRILLKVNWRNKVPCRRFPRKFSVIKFGFLPHVPVLFLPTSSHIWCYVYSYSIHFIYFLFVFMCSSSSEVHRWIKSHLCNIILEESYQARCTKGYQRSEHSCVHESP